MRTLSVGAIFKNEGRLIREWIEHHIHHGVEHFYLIDDNSTDDGVDQIQSYIRDGLVTLFSEREHPYYPGRTRVLYTRHILPVLDHTHWLLMVNLDEFMWSPRGIDLRAVLGRLEHIAQIQVRHTLFGSNGHVERPISGLVESYTRRSKACPTLEPGNLKYFINSRLATVSALGIHTAQFSGKNGENVRHYIMDETWFVLNHYCCQALDVWRDVKCPRGDGENLLVRSTEDFQPYDLNDVEDTRLLDQKRRILAGGVGSSGQRTRRVPPTPTRAVPNRGAAAARYLSVGAIFKNEGHALREWVQHYLHHGVEHIFLIDDASTDGGADTIRDYVERGDVTLFREDDHPYYKGRQVALYNRYILPHIHQSHWLLMVDLDEFMWSPRSVDLRPVLAELDHVGHVQVRNTVFGSNGHIETPRGIVAPYTRRSRQHPTKSPGHLKYFANSSRLCVSSLEVHYAEFTEKSDKSAPFYVMDESWLVLNHYGCQSLNFWRNVKRTRGSANHTEDDVLRQFAVWDLNDVEDTRLLEQNRPILPTA